LGNPASLPLFSRIFRGIGDPASMVWRVMPCTIRVSHPSATLRLRGRAGKYHGFAAVDGCAAPPSLLTLVAGMSNFRGCPATALHWYETLQEKSACDPAS
jgi:hypothetical protein